MQRDLGREIRPASAAYVMYTSGSAGDPKGTVIDHAGLRNLYAFVRARVRELDHGRPMRIALTASFSFDTSWEGLLWMVAGHELHIIADEVRRDAAALVRHIAECGIDVLKLTPTYAEELVEEGLLDSPERRPHVVLLGGEVRPLPAYDSFGMLDRRTDVPWLEASVAGGFKPS